MRLARKIAAIQRDDPDVDQILTALVEAKNESAAAIALGMPRMKLRRRLDRLRRQLAD